MKLVLNRASALISLLEAVSVNQRKIKLLARGDKNSISSECGSERHEAFIDP